MITKKCGKCKQKINTNLFNKNKTKKDGLQTQCKKCESEYKKQLYRKNKPRQIKYTKERRESIRKWMKDLKKSLCCTKCNDNRWYVLEFHHRDSHEKENTISIMVGQGFSKKRILEEIDKCTILCSNCHKELHHFERIGEMADHGKALS